MQRAINILPSTEMNRVKRVWVWSLNTLYTHGVANFAPLHQHALRRRSDHFPHAASTLEEEAVSPRDSAKDPIHFRRVATLYPIIQSRCLSTSCRRYSWREERPDCPGSSWCCTRHGRWLSALTCTSSGESEYAEWNAGTETRRPEQRGIGDVRVRVA